MGGAHSRRKGAAGELEVQALYVKAGWADTHRNFMSGGMGGSDLVGGPDVPEVKRVKTSVRIWEWIEQAQGGTRDLRWALWFRRDHGQWFVTLDHARYLELLDHERKASA